MNYLYSDSQKDYYSVNIAVYKDETKEKKYTCNDAVLGIYNSAIDYKIYDAVIANNSMQLLTGVDYLFNVPLVRGYYYFSLAVPVGNSVEDFSIYIEGCKDVNYIGFVYAMFVLVLVFFAFASIFFAM